MTALPQAKPAAMFALTVAVASALRLAQNFTMGLMESLRKLELYRAYQRKNVRKRNAEAAKAG
jgi:hypothetical protein